jgi:hypothetical protein
MSSFFEQKMDNALFAVVRGGWERPSVWAKLGAGLLCISTFLACGPSAHAAANLVLQSAPTGVILTAAGGNYKTSFGTLNGLGIPAASPTAGVTILTLSNGALYYTTYRLEVTGGLPAGHTANITGYVSTNFANPSALIMQSCPSNQTCNSSGSFSAMPLTSGGATDIVPLPGIPKNTLVTAGFAIFVPDNDGPTGFAGNDGAVITLTAFDGGTQLDQKTLSLNFPSETLQTAVQLTLNSDPAGLAVSPAADYLMAFGNVNGLGIGAGAGLTPIAQAGGIVYSTPYRIQPVFTDFSSTAGTVNVYVSTDFAHPLVLQLLDASAGAGPYSAISKSSGAQTQITNSYSNRSINTRYLGLFVSNANGPTAFTGTDQATLTYTLTVP